MMYATISNRNGKLMIHASLLTGEVKSVLSQFHEDNAGLQDQDCLLCTIASVIDEVSFEKEVVAFSVVVFLNAKNYLIVDDDDLMQELNVLGIHVYKDCNGCWKAQGVNDGEMYFVPSNIG